MAPNWNELLLLSIASLRHFNRQWHIQLRWALNVDFCRLQYRPDLAMLRNTVD